MTPDELFGRYLDLAPLRGKLKGTVRCIFGHPDRTPSLSIDLKRGLFHCFGCGVDGGLKRFADLVGEPFGERRPANSQRRARSPLDEAHAAVLCEARRQPWARPGVQELFTAADWIRARRRLIDRVRRAATEAGPTEAAWEALAAATAEERRVSGVEAAVDELAALLRTPTDGALPPSGPRRNAITVEVVP